MKFWAVGSSFGGTDDRTKEFIQNKNWFDGRYENEDYQNKKHLEQVKINDVLIMKSSSTKGPGHKITFTKVKAIGIVTKIIKTHSYQVKWLENEKFPIDFDGLSYRKVIEPLRQDAIFNYANQLIQKNNAQDKIDLLKIKKQIILQGPPGTGKTRLAKMIAEKMIVTEENIKLQLQINEIIASAGNEQDYYTVAAIKGTNVVLKSKHTKEDGQPANYKNIRNFVLRLVLGENVIASREHNSYELAVAKHLYNKEYQNNFKIIQFHPSYTYEDFVRGITIKSGKDGVLEYITENKVLAKIAKEAHQNFINSKKDKSEYNKEVKVKEYFNDFVDFTSDKIEENNNFFALTDNVGIINLDQDAFRYKGKNDGWSSYGNRMLFKDIIQAFLDGNKERQDLKKNNKLSGLAKQHATYFVRVLNLFKTYLIDNKLKFDIDETKKEPLKNYVLIIDEINRANLSSVLGELIYALEYRGESVESMYELEGEGNSIILPENLYIIGTMNTADRSVGQIDYAIRRRFAFVDILPKVLTEVDLNSNRNKDDSKLFFKEDVFLEVQKLFLKGEENSEHLSEEFNAKDVQLGHSYFIYKDNEFNLKLEYEIKPILREYVTDGILKESALDIINKL